MAQVTNRTTIANDAITDYTEDIEISINTSCSNEYTDELVQFSIQYRKDVIICSASKFSKLILQQMQNGVEGAMSKVTELAAAIQSTKSNNKVSI